jgi:PIN domain nuclease of toxin-antitoxin system
MSRIDALQISTGEAGPVLTPQQKRFNTLIRQIEQARQTLAAWHENIGVYRQAHAQVLLPQQTALMAARREWVFALDVLLGRPGWTRAERGTLRDLVCDMAGELLHAGEDDAALKALFAKHAEVDFDTERQEMVRAMKNMTEAVTGLDLGDDEGIDTDADLFERMQQGLQERAAAEEAKRGAKAAPRRKSAAQQRREAEAQQATQSVREIFRKLASALHPDRETDEQQREIKTALMQKVNQAYAGDDLLTLLELQLQIEQIDAGHIANASAQRLKHYNKVLSEQLAELRAELERVETGFRIDFGLEAGWGMNPRKLGQLLEQNSRELRAELSQQQHDMRMLADVAATKRWLKRQRQLLREAEFDFELF